MEKSPAPYKLMIAIGRIAISLIVMAFILATISIFFSRDQQYYWWLKWGGDILFIVGLILIPFSKFKHRK